MGDIQQFSTVNMNDGEFPLINKVNNNWFPSIKKKGDVRKLSKIKQGEKIITK